MLREAMQINYEKIRWGPKMLNFETSKNKARGGPGQQGPP